MKWVCNECNGSDIQIQAWVDPNTHEYFGDAGPDGECWCVDCDDTTKITYDNGELGEVKKQDLEDISRGTT